MSPRIHSASTRCAAGFADVPGGEVDAGEAASVPGELDGVAAVAAGDVKEARRQNLGLSEVRIEQLVAADFGARDIKGGALG
jgi:hypothetical protein